MIRHYLKIAFRNLRKYKDQTLISVIGLAVGFTCFAVAALWIRYEMTYDGFHKNADRMYCVYMPDSFESGGLSRWAPYSLAAYLKETFPEINNATAVGVMNQYPNVIEVENVECPADLLRIDSSFFSMFDVGIIDGSLDFLIRDSKNIAVTQAKARQLFGNENPVGKVIKLRNDEYTVCAVVSGFSKQSNYPFDFLFAVSVNENRTNHILVELTSGIDMEGFKKKLYESAFRYVREMSIIPLTNIRYKDPDMEKDVKFQYLIIFALAGSLVILCTLFNYLTLFIGRFNIRQKELALRTVYGASNRSLFALLATEFAVSLIIAVLLGAVFMQIIYGYFISTSGIKSELSAVYFELLTYTGAVILISLITFILVLTIFRHGNLNLAIRRSNKKTFRKISVVAQLAISTGFAFCTIIIVKQVYHLHNTTDLGFVLKNRGAVRINRMKPDVYENHIKQIPEITETIIAFQPLTPLVRRMTTIINDWDEKPENVKEIEIETVDMAAKYESFYEFQLIEGEFPNEEGDKGVLINESAVKAFGWENPTGKSLHGWTVKGVIKNIYNFAPAIPAKPTVYSRGNLRVSILFKYREGTWKTCKNKIERMIKEKYPEVSPSDIYLYNSEEEYDKFLKSENALLKILTFVSSICLFICIFGFVSMVSLTCEERRKEIAIRKVSGATVKDILDIFFKEYLTLLAVGALIAFPAGYIIMKRWLEQYVVQTEISAWIYVAILFALILAVVLCVGGKVYKTSRENPVIAIKEN
jgi:ABC-type antimicrobial peptide transport system permease subunit